MNKKNYDESFDRYKDCLVGNAAIQQIGVDIGDTFNPVVKPAILPSCYVWIGLMPLHRAYIVVIIELVCCKTIYESFCE